MSYSNRGRFQQQFSFLRRQFLQDGDLPFSDVLSKEIVTQALTAIEACWKDSIYSPLVTLWVFLGQVLSADHSCRAAVARLIAHRVSRGQRPCSAETGAYCLARKRLPEEFFSKVARQTGCAMEDKADPQWLWKKRRVFAYDGSTVSMPDTPENRERTVKYIFPGGVGWRISFPRIWEFHHGKIEAVGNQGRVLAVVGGGAAAVRFEHSGVLSMESDLGAVFLCLAKEIAEACRRANCGRRQ